MFNLEKCSTDLSPREALDLLKLTRPQSCGCGRLKPPLHWEVVYHRGSLSLSLSHQFTLHLKVNSTILSVGQSVSQSASLFVSTARCLCEKTCTNLHFVVCVCVCPCPTPVYFNWSPLTTGRHLLVHLRRSNCHILFLNEINIYCIVEQSPLSSQCSCGCVGAF